jgi:hypothetical protein
MNKLYILFFIVLISTVHCIHSEIYDYKPEFKETINQETSELDKNFIVDCERYLNTFSDSKMKEVVQTPYCSQLIEKSKLAWNNFNKGANKVDTTNQYKVSITIFHERGNIFLFALKMAFVLPFSSVKTKIVISWKVLIEDKKGNTLYASEANDSFDHFFIRRFSKTDFEASNVLSMYGYEKMLTLLVSSNKPPIKEKR